jgi:PAS domain S-box-containing protein
VVADGRILFANPYVSRIVGYSEEELKNIPFSQFIHPDDIEMVLRNHKRRISGDRDIPVYEFRIIGPNGETLWAELEGVPIEWNGEPAALNFLRDVTERKRTEEALKESEDKYRNLFQNAQVGLFRTAIADGRVLECNELAARMFGFDSREEVVNKAVIGRMWLHPDSRKQMIEELESEGEVRGFEAEVRTKDGSVMWTRFSAKAFPEHGWLEGVVEDISDRKAMEQALWESEKLLAEVFNSIQDAIYVLDPDRNIIRSNVGTRNLFGLRENPVGHRCCEILFGDDRECECCSARKAMETGRLQTSLSRVETVDGRLIWCEFSNYPMTDEKGKIVGVVEYARDVTDRIRAEKALSESEQKYKALTENSTDMIIRIDQSGKCIYANVAAVREFEMELDSILGRTHGELGMPEGILEHLDWSENG